MKELDAELSAPRSPPPRARDSPLLENEIPLETKDSVQVKGHDAGYIQLRIVPDDNSCLFSSVAVVFEGGLDKAQELRKGKLEVFWRADISRRRCDQGRPGKVLRCHAWHAPRRVHEEDPGQEHLGWRN